MNNTSGTRGRIRRKFMNKIVANVRHVPLSGTQVHTMLNVSKAD